MSWVAEAGARTLVLFGYDWDTDGFARVGEHYRTDHEGFDLFSFPSNVRLGWFDIEHFVTRLQARAERAGWRAVVSNHEQFGALAAALLAERMGWPGTSVQAVLACQHKLHARQVLARVCPEVNIPFAPLQAAYGEPVPDNLQYPLFVKPVKAAFSVLATRVGNHAALHAHTRFGRWERWVIRRLVEPFDRVARKRLPQAGTAHRMLLEQPVRGEQYNLDGFVFNGRTDAVGVVHAVMYPGTDAFMRFDYPSGLPQAVQVRALDVARRFLAEVGFTHGMFNMEFFHDPETGKITVIEFNPRMSPQMSDLYLRVLGVDMHHMLMALAWNRDPGLAPRVAPVAGAASSFVYRIFDPATPVRQSNDTMRREFRLRYPEGLLLEFPKPRGSMQRDFKWLGSYRYAIIHLGGTDAADLRRRCEDASAIFGWPPPYLENFAEPTPLDNGPNSGISSTMETT